MESIQFSDGTISVADSEFNYAPVISGDGELDVDVGGTATITGDDLGATDTEDGAEGITFILLDDPDFGSLMLKGEELGESDNFIQVYIDDGILSYTQYEDAGDATTVSFRFAAKDSANEETRDDDEGSSGYQVSDDGGATFNITIDVAVM